jgi:hypothetical protein
VNGAKAASDAGANSDPPALPRPKEKGRSGERPKFREETPRKGRGTCSEERNAAPHKYATAPHQSQGRSEAGHRKFDGNAAPHRCPIGTERGFAQKFGSKPPFLNRKRRAAFYRRGVRCCKNIASRCISATRLGRKSPAYRAIYGGFLSPILHKTLIDDSVKRARRRAVGSAVA